MGIFLIGDIHGNPRRLGGRFFNHLGLSRNDCMVILGDFGLIWSDPPSPEETWWLDWLEQRAWTTLVVLGNHENHRIIRAMPTESWKGGRVRRFREHVLQLVDNEVFEIDGKTFFVRGGAHSFDRDLRVEGKDWWPEEVPDAAERAAARDKLDAIGWRVDYVLTHAAPSRLHGALNPDPSRRNAPDEYARWLQEIADWLDFERWFFGHHHQNRYDLGRYTCLYGDVAEPDGRPSERVR